MLVRKTRIPIFELVFTGFMPSSLKKIFYRLKGYKIGKNVSIGLGSVIIGKDVVIGDHTKIAYLTMIRGRSIHLGRFVKIGSMSVIDTEKIFIDEDARINEQVYIGGMKTPESSIRLGKRTIIMQLSYINPTLPIEIGDDTGIGGHCLLFTHGSWNNQLEGFPVKFAPIRLGKKVWLPWRVFVMPGTTVGDNVVIGGDSLLQGDIPSNSLAAGSPAKIIRNNYPEKPSEEKKQAIIDSIFGDYTKYLEYNGYAVEKVNDINEVLFHITKGDRHILLQYSRGGLPMQAVKYKDAVLVITRLSNDGIQQALKAGWKTVLALDNQMRGGSSDAGEETVSFFSRYGIRFGRI